MAVTAAHIATNQEDCRTGVAWVVDCAKLLDTTDLNHHHPPFLLSFI